MRMSFIHTLISGQGAPSSLTLEVPRDCHPAVKHVEGALPVVRTLVLQIVLKECQ